MVGTDPNGGKSLLRGAGNPRVGLTLRFSPESDSEENRLFKRSMHQEQKPEERMERSDEYLLEMAIRGDGGSFGELVRRWERRIHGFIRRYVGDREEALDLTQNTFVKAYENLDRLSNPSFFSSWLYKIALNECRMRFRRQARRRDVSIEDTGAEVEWRERDLLTPERTLVGRELVERVESAFRRLPREQREVILMKELQGLRFQDIAEILNVPLSTAKSRLYVGLKSLRKLVEELP
jgi:RNA polymerase sigma-70 factor, ECF subfamily